MNTSYPIEIFKTDDGQIRLEVQLTEETVWLTQAQLVMLFDRDQSVISRHVSNIFTEGELLRESNMQKMHIAGSDKPVAFYNLDVIISVGYRVKSQRGVHFRQWATQTLKQHLIQGYTLNRKRLAQLGTDVDRLMGLMHKTLTHNSLIRPEGVAIANLIRDYARTWKLLLAYDERKLDEPDGLLHEPVLDKDTVQQAIGQLKTRLLQNCQATDLFGRERNQALDGILGNLHQTFDGQLLYPTAQGRAAHLLYFVIKDHPFADGNKRIGSFLFLLYLQSHALDYTSEGRPRFADNALVAIALLVAESDPGQKELMIRLIQHLIGEGA
ncbi:MAG: virulence protein RhuM/Fic/DOC family protein [Deltaproteobacteria bacterium]|nr:virulence protein RhuM/Fic/DOC family protein [Deltaproteobacteria bacterium]